MRTIANIIMLLVLFGCAGAPLDGSEKTAMAQLPAICKAVDPYGADDLGDSYANSRSYWMDFDRHYAKAENRKLLVFMDGTANEKTDMTNIRAMYRLAVKRACDGEPIIAYYDKGVGAKWFDSFIGGVTGYGASLNIRQGYRFLVGAYKPGDEIFLFGFSRGAFTARSLNGFIEYTGLLDRRSVTPKWYDQLFGGYVLSSQHEAVKTLWEEYHRPHDGTPGFERNLGCRMEKKVKDLGLATFNKKVKAIGVYDTVAALGIGRNDDPDRHRVDLYAEAGFHAMSLDEQRNDFRLIRFHQRLKQGQRLEEVWFPGVHSDVGGGYDKSFGCNTTNSADESYLNGLETIPLNWMIDQFAQYRIFHGTGNYNECVDGRMHDEFFKKHFLYGTMGVFRRTPLKGDRVHGSILCRKQIKSLPWPDPCREPDGVYPTVNLTLGEDDVIPIDYSCAPESRPACTTDHCVKTNKHIKDKKCPNSADCLPKDRD